MSAVQLVLNVSPDVVLMDLGLPRMDGWDAIRGIRTRLRTERTHYAPYIIAVSAFGDGESRRRAFDAGCNEYIVKPLDVRGALCAFVARRGHRSALLDGAIE